MTSQHPLRKISTSLLSIVTALGASLLGPGCTRSELRVAAEDPANPKAASAPQPAVGAALRPGFDPANDARLADAASQWTCPMHPEILRNEPGTCPICHMKLVPVQKKQGAGAAH